MVLWFGSIKICSRAGNFYSSHLMAKQQIEWMITYNLSVCILVLEFYDSNLWRIFDSSLNLDLKDLRHNQKFNF